MLSGIEIKEVNGIGSSYDEVLLVKYAEYYGVRHKSYFKENIMACDRTLYKVMVLGTSKL